MDYNKKDTIPPDDSVVRDEQVAEHYRSFMQHMGVQISIAKWLVTRSGCHEYAKQPEIPSVNLHSHREQNQPGPEQPTFSTACLYRKKSFVAYDLSIHGEPSGGATSTQPTVVSQPEKVCQNVPKVQPQSSARDFSSDMVQKWGKRMKRHRVSSTRSVATSKGQGASTSKAKGKQLDSFDPFVAYDLKVQGAPSGAISIQPTVAQPKKVCQNVAEVQPQSSARVFSSDVVQIRGKRMKRHRVSSTRSVATSKGQGDSTSKAKGKQLGSFDPFVACVLNVQGAPSGATSIQPTVSQPKKVCQNVAEVQPQSSAKVFSFDVVQIRGKRMKRRRTPKWPSRSPGSLLGSFLPMWSTKGVVAAEQIFSNKPGTSKFNKGSKTIARVIPVNRQVVYNEDSDDDTVEPRKASRPSTVVGDQNVSYLKEAASKTTKAGSISADMRKDKALEEQQENVPSEGISHKGYAKVEACNRTGKEAARVEDNREKSIADDPIQLSPRNKNLPDPELIEVFDPEFYIFDNDRKKDSFEFGQMWAIYDDMDCMPRFYAWIRKILSPGFKVRITWLEADPDDDDEIEWFNEGLPVSCGKYKLGKTEITEEMNMFSHVVTWVLGPSRGSLLIYPKKGETWALFKNWDMNWSSGANNHTTYEYDFVEVLSDYDQGSGISVANLEKVKGFVSLFCLKKGVASVQIPPNELYRFAHMVPSYRTTGNEREGVSEGFFELDPASVPTNLVNPN